MRNLNRRPIVIFLLVLVAAGLLTACNAGAGANEATEPTTVPVVADEGGIVSEGRLVPRESVDLTFVTSGEVAEVLVKEGDTVKAGDVLATLGNQETLEAAIAGAELELVSANKALGDLNDQWPNDKSAALEAISTANKAVRDAQYNLDNFTVPTNQEDLGPFEAVEVMKERLDKARDAFEPYKNKRSGDSIRQDRKEDLDNAQSDYNSAVRRLQLQVALDTAKSKLDKAMEDYKALEQGPKAEDVSAVQARITSAESALASAKAALDDLQLKAPMDGTVVDVNIIVGENVKPAELAFSLADFSQWYVETDDLTEIEVVDINPGQEVTIVADAIPDLELKGVVDQISEKYEEKRGDVTYTVKILMNEIDPRLRWGMTVAVKFQE